MNVWSSVVALLLLVLASNSVYASLDSLENLLQVENLSEVEVLDIKLKILRSLNYGGDRSDTLSVECIDAAQRLNMLILEAKAKYARAQYLATKYVADKEHEELVRFVDSISFLFPDDNELYLHARVSNGKYSWLKREYDKAAEEFRNAVHFAEAHSMREQYFFLRRNLALNLGLSKQFFEAIKVNNASLKDPGARPYFVHANLADLYGQINDWENYLKHASLLLEEAEQINNAQAIFVGHIRKSEGLMKTGDLEKAEDLLHELLLRSELLIEHPTWYISIYGALIDIYIENEEWEKGISITDALSKIEVDRRFTYATLAGKIGQCYLKVGNVSEAVRWCEDGKAVAMASGSRKFRFLPTVCECLSAAYMAKGDYRRAFENLSLANENSGVEREQAKILDLSRALNQQELLKQEEIMVLEQEKRDARNLARLSKYKYFGIFSILFALVTLVFVRKLRERNRSINNSNSRLLKALGEKEILLKEIHHRVKNNLQVISSLLSLHSKYVDDEHAVSALNEGQNRVESMVLIHQNLYREDNISGVDMKQYIPLLGNSIFQSYNIQGDSIEMKYDIDKLTLDVATVIPIGLVLNELISNALKYAFPDSRRGTIRISLVEKANHILLSVADDGIGMSDKHASGGFGTKLIRSFARKLEGELKINTEDGTAIEILISNFKRA